ncbi:YciI family protein [Sphingomonas sp.]|uniref:YciI family protein n=1 Tax=Sphingomonas sp. TaxID=28214 RepID=UPI001B0E520F|nr:YciI family protein [Sphingomonas sp.]MBO9714493.1 GTP cyclohydrolase [Sphingomonas sp.]
MILVLLTYKVSEATILELRPAHRDWLAAGMAEGRLLAAGRKVPVTGGMFMVRGTVDEAKAWIESDPFRLAGAADYEFVEIEVTMAAPELAALTA